MAEYGVETIINTIAENNGLFGIFANPGFGTTTFVMQLANAIIKEKNGKILVFSLALSKERWKQRMLSMDYQVDRVVVVDTFELSLEIINSEINKLESVNLVIIDYLGLLDRSVSQNIKSISQKYAVPIVVCGKLPRNSGDFAPKHRPGLYTLYGSKIDLDDFDFLVLLHRDHKCDRGIGTAYRYNISNISELIIKVNRFGDIGSAFMEWDELTKSFIM